MSALPKSDDVDPKPFAHELAGRPLSDVAFVVREGARLAARSGKNALYQESLLAALESAPAREREGGQVLAAQGSRLALPERVAVDAGEAAVRF